MLNTGPQPFPGSEAEKRENQATHDWGNYGGQTMCQRCEAKPWHVAAQWPCGTNPPREPIVARMDTKVEEER